MTGRVLIYNNSAKKMPQANTDFYSDNLSLLAGRADITDGKRS